MTLANDLLVLLAGLAAGILTSSVGVASLASFPLLLALGIAPVVANASNTVGLAPAALSGTWGYRHELAGHRRLAWVIVSTSAIGSVAGAALLLQLDPGVFQRLVPWLILFTCTLVGVQPWLSRWLRRRSPYGEVRTDAGRGTIAMAVLTGVYAGYFGAGSGVMMVAVLGFGLDLDLRIVNGLKTLAVGAADVVASVIFIVVADLDCRVVALLAVGSVIGGHVGARVGRRLPPAVMRTLIVVAGIVAAIVLA